VPREAEIVVHADRGVHRVTPHMTGACIEDVNHEVYGGIYSQMIFGECFQEPPLPPRFEQFDAFLGRWEVEGGELLAASDERANVVARDIDLINGEVGVEMRVEDDADGFAGLIVKVNDPGIRIDSFRCYGAEFNPGKRVVRIARESGGGAVHRVDTPFDVPVGRWMQVVVKFSWSSVEVLVDGKSIARLFETHDPLRSGGVGLMVLNQRVRFRDFWVNDCQKRREIPFDVAAEPDAAEGAGVSRMWRPVRRGSAGGRFGLETESPYAGVQSQRITFVEGDGDAGIENMALNRWGMCFRKGKDYDGCLWVQCEKPTKLVVALESADGARTYAEQTLDARAGDWTRLAFTLTPDADDHRGRFAVLLREPGSAVLGYAFLQPGEWGRFKGLPVRRDIAEGLVEHALTVLRCGGCLVNNPKYLWKDMIGPRDRRPAYIGSWYRYFTHGWAMIDVADFAEAAGCLYIPDVSIDETPEDLVDLLDYLNGPPDSEWGRRRVDDGHPEPYNLKIIEFGNEQNVGDFYWSRFRPAAEAIWSHDPSVILVVGDLYYGEIPEHPDYFEDGERVSSLNVRRDIMALAKQYDAEVWFDVHVSTDTPENIFGLKEAMRYFKLLEEINPGARMKFAVLELNANNHGVRRALANALAINLFERMGDRIPVVCSANCLQPDGQNDHGWDQGLLFFNPSSVWPQPALQVTQMISRNYLPNLVETDVEEAFRFDVVAAQRHCAVPDEDATPERGAWRPPEDAACGPGGVFGLDVVAKVSGEEPKELVLRVVNVAMEPIAARIRLDGFTPTQPTARVTELSGEPDDVNTADDPQKIAPKERDWEHGFQAGALSYTFAPYSFTLIRLG